MFHRVAFDRRSRIIRGLGRSLSKFFAISNGIWSELFQEFMKPALLAEAKSSGNSLRARFALYYTYSFLPVRSEIKTCQEQVSPCLSKMNLCPSAPCWGLRTPIPRGSISSYSFAEKSAKVFFKMIMARMKTPRHLFCFLKLLMSKIFDMSMVHVSRFY